MGERFSEVGGAVTLCYEQFGEPSDPPLLLVMGLGMQMLGWHEDFCEQLAGHGFLVTRFDNRDTGRSTHIEDLRPATPRQIATRRFDGNQYELADMAQDAAGLLNALGLAPAHVVGASMGGMIGQTLAARHPGSVRSLTSLMSNTGHRWRGQPALSMYRHMLKRAPRDREGYVEHTTRLFEAIGSPGMHDAEDFRERAALSFDRDSSRAGLGRQLGAILASGDRTEELARIAAPTLVIHGSKDKLVLPSGGRATARAIPGARLETVEGMGHDLPRVLWPRLTALVAEHARAADAALAPATA